MSASNPNPEAFRRVTGSPKARELEALAGQAVHLEACDLADADVSGLDMAGWWFQRCVLRGVRATGAVLDGALFDGCRGGWPIFAGRGWPRSPCATVISTRRSLARRC